VDAYIAAGYEGAKKTTCAYTSASQIFRKPHIQEEIEKRREANFKEYKARMDAQIPDAIEARGRIISYPNMSSATQMKAIADVLDRAGLKLPQEHKITQEQEVSVKLDVMTDASRDEHLELLSRFAAVCNGGKESVAEPGTESE
jgi:hypothetical protein